MSSGNYFGHSGEPCDEVDIMEGYMPDPKYFHTCQHQWSYGGESAVHTDNMIETATIGAGSNIAQTFHTYGVLITETTTYFYFDSVLVISAPTLPHSWNDGNYFMITNALQAAFMNNSGGFQRYGKSGDMYIDWVRVYEAE